MGIRMVYKPTYNWGAPSCVFVLSFSKTRRKAWEIFKAHSATLQMNLNINIQLLSQHIYQLSLPAEALLKLSQVEVEDAMPSFRRWVSSEISSQMMGHDRSFQT